MAILNVLWDEGRTTIRTITDRLYPEGKPSEYATVKSLLKRLEDKGCVARDRDTTYHIYQATISRNYMIAHKLKEVADTLCGGSYAPILMYLFEEPRLNKKEKKTLRKFLETIPA
jgi:predicted transcriptional regulator